MSEIKKKNNVTLYHAWKLKLYHEYIRMNEKDYSRYVT